MRLTVMRHLSSRPYEQRLQAGQIFDFRDLKSRFLCFFCTSKSLYSLASTVQTEPTDFGKVIVIVSDFFLYGDGSGARAPGPPTVFCFLFFPTHPQPRTPPGRALTEKSICDGPPPAAQENSSFYVA